jgi:tetratricopeptide (TPR) repeat protein
MRWLFTGMLIVLLALTAKGDEGDEGRLLRQGEQYLTAGEYRKALKVFIDAARLKPDSAAAYRGMGLARFRLGANEVMTDTAQLEDAVAAFTTSLRLKPDFAEVRYQLGLALLTLHNREAAIREYESLRNLDQELAKRLMTSITSYKPPLGYHEVGASSEAGDRITRVTIIGNQVLVPVTIGYGERVIQAQFLLDTGASATIITPEVATRLDVNPERTVKSIAQVVGGALIEARTFRINYLTAGPRTRTGMEVRIIPHAGPPVPFDGLLGMDFLRGLSYQIDFNRGLILWGP